MVSPKVKASVSILTAACLPSLCTSFVPVSLSVFEPSSLSVQREEKIAGDLPHHHGHGSTSSTLASSLLPSEDDGEASSFEASSQSRRSFFVSSLVTTFGVASCFDGSHNVAFAAEGNLGTVLEQIKEARGQLDEIPDLIKDEKWDAVRAILVKPPLSSMWTSGGRNKMLNDYADAIGNELPDGDEIAALEFREDIISHLRYLDMAVYNNVFNPIGSEGTSGATKELIRSYYEDPTNEWKASTSAIDGLIGLASP